MDPAFPGCGGGYLSGSLALTGSHWLSLGVKSLAWRLPCPRVCYGQKASGSELPPPTLAAGEPAQGRLGLGCAEEGTQGSQGQRVLALRMVVALHVGRSRQT